MNHVSFIDIEAVTLVSGIPVPVPTALIKTLTPALTVAAPSVVLQVVAISKIVQVRRGVEVAKSCTVNTHISPLAAAPGAVAPPGGENGWAIAARAVPAIEEIVRRHPEGNVLVVSHKATIRVIICALLGVDLNLFRARIGAPVASIATIEFKSTGPLVTSLGDTSHLPPRLRNAGGT